MSRVFDAPVRRTDEAAFVGFTHGVLLGLLGVLVLIGTSPVTAADLAPFGYVALILGLSYGVALRSRGAAAVLLALVVLMEGTRLLGTPNLVSIPTLFLACPFYVRGLIGAVQWHRLERHRTGGIARARRLP